MKLSWKSVSLALILVALVTMKMIAFEPYALGVAALRVHPSAALLPLGLLFGWWGVGGFAIACGVTHLVLPDSLGIADGLGAGISVLVSTTLAYLTFRSRRSPLSLLVGTWVQVAGVSLGFGLYTSLLTDVSMGRAITNVLLNVWISTGVLGFVMALGVARWLRPVLAARSGLA